MEKHYRDELLDGLAGKKLFGFAPNMRPGYETHDTEAWKKMNNAWEEAWAKEEAYLGLHPHFMPNYDFMDGASRHRDLNELVREVVALSIARLKVCMLVSRNSRCPSSLAMHAVLLECLTSVVVVLESENV